MRSLLSSTILCVVACTSATTESTAEQPPASPQLTAVTTAEPPPAVTTPEPHRPQPGAALFLLDDKGLVMLSADGQLRTLERSIDTTLSFFVTGFESVYVVGSSNIGRLVDARFEALTKLARTGTIHSAAVAPDGSLWVTDTKGLARHADDNWTHTERDSIAEDLDGVLDVEFDQDGQPWLITSPNNPWRSETLHRLHEDQRWKAVKSPIFPEALHRGPAGELYLQTDDGLFEVRDPETFIEIPLGGEYKLAQSAISPTGRFALAIDAPPMPTTVKDDSNLPGPDWANCELLRVDPSDSAWTRKFTIGTPGECPPITALAIDASDRIWAASPAGLFVLGPDAEVRAHPWGSVPELADNIGSLLVMGLGPTTISEPGPVQTGSVTAKLTLDGEPLAGAKIEICRLRHYNANRSPCSDDPARITGRTNSKGRIEIEALPLGSYRLHVRAQGDWHSARISATCMRADAACDLGTLEVEYMH